MARIPLHDRIAAYVDAEICGGTYSELAQRFGTTEDQVRRAVAKLVKERRVVLDIDPRGPLPWERSVGAPRKAVWRKTPPSRSSRAPEKVRVAARAWADQFRLRTGYELRDFLD